MYYRGSTFRMPGRNDHETTCYAESDDGIHWRRPKLGFYEFDGSKENNIILMNDEAIHNFAPCYGGGLPGLSDGGFISSRDGIRCLRWDEALVRPGLQHERWINRNDMSAQGVVLTPADIKGLPPVLSIYSTEAYDSEMLNRLRRLTLWQDGFVSVQAPYSGGSVTLKPLPVEVVESSQIPGRQGYTVDVQPDWSDVMLLLNASTSALGEIRCEIRDEQNKPIPGYALEDSVPVFGDELDLPMAWKNGTDVKPLIGRKVILHFEMKDADIYSLRFGRP